LSKPVQIKLSIKTYGKRGQLVGEIIDESGTVIRKDTGPTITHVSRQLRRSGLVPTDLVIQKNMIVGFVIYRKNPLSAT